METTTSDIYTEDFIKKLADNILSKFEISSEFLNNIVDKSATAITKTKKINIVNNNDNVISNSKNKTSNSNNVVDPSNDNLKISTNSKIDNPIPSLLQAVNKTDNENLNTEEKISNKNSYLEKIKGVLENTSNKLEKVLNTPRPWELTPGTSMGYQMLKGDDDTITERSRKGFAQFMGRYATNIKQPFDYSLDDIKNQSFTQMLKQVLTDVPGWSKNPTGPTGQGLPAGYTADQMSARDTLYRELFDLPERFKDDNILKKTGNKNYTLKNFAPNPNLALDTEKQSKSFSLGNPILGNVAVSKNTEGNYSYKDVWDLISSGEDEGTSFYSDLASTKATYPLRKLISPLLRPATVSGTVTKEGEPIPSNNNNNTRQETQQKASTGLLNNKTSLLSTISKGLEKALNIPRPWELTPGTSMGYQMLTGKESIGERARKGFAQSMGRYVTNIADPGLSFELPKLKDINLKNIITDKAKWLNYNSSQEPIETNAREVLSREMFDLPSRRPLEDIKKIGDKQYTLTNPYQNWQKNNRGWNFLPELTEETRMDGSKTYSGEPVSLRHTLLGGVYAQPNLKENAYSYNDIWDLKSSNTYNTDKTSKFLRELIAPILRPATVKGEIYRDEKNLSSFLSDTSPDKLTKQYKNQKQPTTELPKNWTDQVPILNPLINQLEKVIKQQSKSEDLNKISSTQTNILDDSSKFKTKSFEPNITKSILDKTISQPTPSLQSVASKENLGINNSALDKIVNNTDRTNNAIKNLGDTIFKLAQTLNNSSSKTPQMTPVYNNTTSSRQQSVPNAVLSQTNYDPIAAVRKQFFYNPD